MIKQLDIYFARHGESVANTKDWVTGDIHDPLTALGREQAKRLGVKADSIFRSAGISFDAVLTSSFLRAQETALIAFPNFKIEYDPRLSETDAGTVKNMTRSDFIQLCPDFWTPFDSSRPFPDGESHMDLFNRVASWLNDLVKRTHVDSKYLIVGHSGSLGALLQYVFSIPMNKFPVFLAPNASLTHLRLQVAVGEGSIVNAQLCFFGV